MATKGEDTTRGAGGPLVRGDVPRHTWSTPRVIEASIPRETAGGYAYFVYDSSSPGVGHS